MVKTKETTRKGTIKRTNEDAQCTSKKTKKDYAARTKFFVVSSTTKGGRSKAHITIRRYPGRNNVSWPKKRETFNGRVVDRKRKKRGVVGTCRRHSLITPWTVVCCQHYYRGDRAGLSQARPTTRARGFPPPHNEPSIKLSRNYTLGNKLFPCK